jgi:hypothetical protein
LVDVVAAHRHSLTEPTHHLPTSHTMSISSLANIATPNIPLPSQPISAATTRILTLSNFSPQIKTKDLHQAFQPWAEDKGGYKIKWIDDVTALAVFNDATVGEYRFRCLGACC